MHMPVWVSLKSTRAVIEKKTCGCEALNLDEEGTIRLNMISFNSPVLTIKLFC